MIKRRFYKLEHGDRKDEPSDSSSSSSFSEAGEGFESDDDAVVEQGGEAGQTCSASSEYETEYTTANQLGLPINEEDDESDEELRVPGDNQSSDKHSSRFLNNQLKQVEENELLSAYSCVIKFKSVFKCSLCPGVVCLNEESLRTHLMSKRHARSEKLLNEARRKDSLTSDGEIDDEDTLTKEDAEIEAVSQGKQKREKGGRQRQRRRRQNKELKRKKVGRDSDSVKTRSSKESQTKKRRKREN